MRTFTNTCAQGDILIQRVECLPDGVEPVAAEHGKCVVAHSETGHNHVMDAGTTTLYRVPDDLMCLFADVKAPTDLEHQRAFDTHETIRFEPGIYRIRRQREYTPEGWRRVED